MGGPQTPLRAVVFLHVPVVCGTIDRPHEQERWLVDGHDGNFMKEIAEADLRESLLRMAGLLREDLPDPPQ